MKRDHPYTGPNYLTVRTTINVLSRTPRETAEAIPQLLGQLGVPLDAVGVVGFLEDYSAGGVGGDTGGGVGAWQA